MKGGAKILGVWFSPKRSEEEHYALNFAPQLDKMKQVCSSWSCRSLSLKGRATVFNSLIISLILYIAANSVTPSRVVTEVRKLALSFLWAGKKAKIAYSSLIQSIPGGGLKVMDLESRLQVNFLCWIRKILSDQHSTAAEFTRGMLGGEDLTLLLGTKRPIPHLAAPLSPFYTQILRFWAKVHDFPPEGEEAIRREVLWDNHRIPSATNMMTGD